MSQLLEGLGSPVLVQALNPTHFANGLPFTEAGALAIENLAPIDHYHQGLPFTPGGRISVALNGTVSYYGSGNAPFSAAGFLVLGTGPVDHYAGGVGFTASNQIASVQGTVSPEVQAVFNRMSALTPTEEAAIEAFVDGMVALGLWAGIFEFYAPCLNASDYLTGFKADTLLPSASPPVHTPGEYADFINNSQHFLEGRDFDAYSTQNIFMGCYNVFTAADTVQNSDMFGVENGGATTYFRWRGNDTNDFNELIGQTSAAGRSAANVRPEGDIVGQARSSGDTFNLQPGNVIDSTVQAFVAHPSGGPIQWHGHWTNGVPSAGNMANSRYSCMFSMATPSLANVSNTRALMLQFLIDIGVTGVPIP